jgi:DNA mismatch repair protein MutH
MIPPPTSERELLVRVRALAGAKIGDVARSLGLEPPPDLTRHKGWVGQLFEHALGATAASRDEPDFEALGVELKSLPVTPDGKPVESTFVCTIPLGDLESVPWERSRVRRKLARVLWLPFEGERTLRVAERRIGAGFLWSPSADEEAALRADWEELGGIIGRGGIESLTAHLGRFLQVRPKAANARVTRRAIDDEGVMTETLPRGFYLRTQFTGAVLRANVHTVR